MAAFVTMTSDDGVYIINQWHMGDPDFVTEIKVRNKNESEPKIMSRVFSVQLDGDELEYVITRIRDLPVTSFINCPVQTWYGDHAKFIVGNLLGR